MLPGRRNGGLWSLPGEAPALKGEGVFGVLNVENSLKPYGIKCMCVLFISQSFRDSLGQASTV